MNLFIAVAIFTLTIGTTTGYAQSGTPDGARVPADSASAQTAAALQAIEARHRQAIFLAPEVASYRAGLAQVLQRQGRFDEAETEYRESVRLDPYAPRNRALLGQFLLQKGDASDAVEHLQMAEERDPVNPAHSLGLADAYGRLGRWADAARTLAHAAALAPSDSQYTRALRTARLNAGIRLDAPIEGLNEAAGRPVILRIIELTLGGILALSGVALVYPILSGILLAMRAGVAGVSTSRA